MKKQSVYKTEMGKIAIREYYENLLKSWPEPCKHHFVDTCYGRTFIIENGKAGNSIVVLLHGSGSNSAMWKADVAKYAKHYHVFSIDIIGECGKSETSRPKFANGNYAAWLMEVFEQFKIEKATIIGCSLGGWIAIDFSTHFPEKVEKLVLIATAGITQVKARTILWIMATSAFGTWGLNKLNKMVYGNAEIDRTAREFGFLIKQHFRPRTDVLSVFSNDELKRMECPVYFIGGENDCFYHSNATARRLKEQTKNTKTCVLKETGHVVINQTSIIIQFLNE